MISIIACVGQNLELGKGGDLAFTGRGELGYFKTTTMGHKVIMGYNTFVSLPGPLPGRECYVASHDPKVKLPQWATAVTDLIGFLEKYQKTPEEIFVIGGGSVYALSLPYAQKLYLTEVDATCPDADTFFPKFDLTNFNRQFIKKGAFDDGLTFSRYVYTRK